MIDTIVLKVDCSKAPGLLQSFIERTTVKQRYGKVNRNSLEVNYGGNFYQVFKDFFKIKSSEYRVNWYYSDSDKKLVFNMSVPKYVYGNNVMQFVVDRDDYEFHDMRMKEMLEQSDVVFKKLYLFVDRFRTNILMERVTNNDIEISRIDICYNRIMRDKDEVDRYFEAVKSKGIKYLRQMSNKLRNYDTAFMYIGKGYSFKVYKKGVEFEKNDLKEIKKRKDYEVIRKNVERLKMLADRVVRYEMTIRKEYINRKYKENLYRKDDKVWKSLVKKMLKGEKINREYKEQIKSHYYRSHDFVFETLSNEKELNEKFSNYYSKKAKFSRSLFKILVDEFIKREKEFRVTSVKKYAENIKGYEMLLRIDKLGYTLEDAYRIGMIKKTTFYKYKKIIKEKGLELIVMNEEIKQKLDYEEYYQEIMNTKMLIN